MVSPPGSIFVQPGGRSGAPAIAVGEAAVVAAAVGVAAAVAVAAGVVVASPFSFSSS
jgi:hypothetical protein